MSKAIFKENIRRYWMITVAGCLLYFLCGPVLVIFGNFENPYNDNIISQMSVSSMPLCYFIPAAFAGSVFAYLFKTSSCSVMHSMPFSRKKLYITNYVSGLIMSLVPALFNFAAMFVSRGIVIAKGIDAENIISTVSLSNWFYESAVMVIYVYSLCVLAAMVSGNGVISALTGFGFNALAPLFVGTIILYADTFLYGFAYSEDHYNLIISLHPAFKVFENIIVYEDSRITILSPLYILVAAAITFLGYYFYKKRKLENAGDSYVFKTAKSVIGILITFFASSLTGILFFDLFDSRSGYMAFLIAAIVGFIISRMIISRSPRIINFQSLKEFIITVVIIGGIIVFFVFDVIGYEKNVPAPKNIASAEFECGYYNVDLVGKTVMIFTEKDTLKNVTDFHRYIAERGEEDASETYAVDITYTMNNGSEMRRRYHISKEVLDGYDYKKLLHSKECIEAAKGIAGLDTGYISDLYIDGTFINGELKSTDPEAEKLLTCISKDYLERLENAIIDEDDYKDRIYINISYRISDEEEINTLNRIAGYQYSYTDTIFESGKKQDELFVEFMFDITEDDTNTWKLLREIRDSENLIPNNGKNTNY